MSRNPPPRFGEHSFDQRLHELLMSKRALSRAVLAPPSASDEEIERLFEGTVG